MQAETCPQYLFLDQTIYDRPHFEGAKWVMTPALREKWNQTSLWQGLKFDDEATRAGIARLSGHRAKSAGHAAPARDVIGYGGQIVRVGTVDHWALMDGACAAKFAQCEPARAALLSTGNRPLEHKVPADSRTIPGVIMADIWMRLRDGLTSAPVIKP